ncbi:serine hydrolase domain-containing protein [Catenulispora rubra]|uniref:serine hydrolase domain-containing protein n=1 Tax=Catenulispora rubra TaxID=280293 RepID=UPI0018927695|nr:serine hydrolase domain-containing protein [Catenulispora rubra]
MTTIHGFADEGFGPVADAFAENFRLGTELGAACAVYHHGRLVVDLHAGVADDRTGRPWTDDTLTVGFSVTKGLMALCGHLARQRGLLDFDAPVASVWPEFAAGGKQDIAIRDLFSHRSGLMALDVDLTIDDVASWFPVIHAIEEQKPLWEPGTTFAYHALMFGWLTGEVLRRVTGLRPGPLIADYLTGPLGADAWIGLPESEASRVAYLAAPPAALSSAWVEMALALPTVVRSMTLGGAFPPLLIDDRHPSDFNSRVVQAVEVPAANGIMSARALARIYSAAVSTTDGRPKLLDDASIMDALTVRSIDNPWPGALTPPGMRFSTGFLTNGIPHRPLLSDASFGHDGASGSLGYADADHEIGFGYVNNSLAGAVDGRANRLTAALRSSMGL